MKSYRVIIISLILIFNFFSFTVLTEIAKADEYTINYYYRINGGDWKEDTNVHTIGENDLIEIKAEVILNGMSPEFKGISHSINIDYSVEYDDLAAYKIISGKKDNVYPCGFWEDTEECQDMNSYQYIWGIKPTGDRVSPEISSAGIPEYNYFVIEVETVLFYKQASSSKYSHVTDEKIVFGAYIVDKNSTNHPGSNPGELNRPRGIDIGSDGYVYVADTGNSRIQVFTKDGSFVKEFGSLTSDDDFVNILLAEDGYLYTPEAVKYDLDGNKIENVVNTLGADDIEITSNGDIYFTRLYGTIEVLKNGEENLEEIDYSAGDASSQKISIGPDGRIYQNGYNLRIFYPNGTLYKETFANSMDVKIIDNTLYSLSYTSINAYDLDGNWIKTIPLELNLTNYKTNVIAPSFDIDTNGDFYIADMADNRVVVFDKDGNFLRSFGEGNYSPSSSTNEVGSSDGSNTPGFEIVTIFSAIIIFIFLFKKKKS
ncbi:MAG: hypothetical protein KAW45_02935 [Thermoplasmatales archaeon]|nr:hypothetical protein [Thermoplasmatales archaeon]